MQLQTASGATIKSIPNPIPVSEVKAYCDFMDMNDTGQRVRLLSAMQAMDAAYIKFSLKS